MLTIILQPLQNQVYTFIPGLPPSRLLLIAILVFTFIQVRKLIRSKKAQKAFPIQIGRYQTHCLIYVSRCFGNTVLQQWEIDKSLLKKRTATMSSQQKHDFKKEVNATLKLFNSKGVRETNGSKQYAGKVEFKLTSPNKTHEYEFGHLDYLEYMDGFKKFKVVRVTDQFDVMKSSAWGKADLRLDLSIGITLWNGEPISEQSNEELKAFLNTLLRKIDYTSKVLNKNTLAPWEDQYFQGTNYQRKINAGTAEVVYETHLDALKKNMNGLKPNADITTSKGVHIGDGRYIDKEGHFLTVGGARSGKGTSLIIPQLLDHDSYQGSIMTIDVKGTLTAITARSMQERGIETIILDPWNTQDKFNAKHNRKKDSLNPLDILDENSDDLIDDCDMIAEQLVPKNSDTKDPYWEDRARSWVSTYLLYLAHRPKEERTLSKLRSLFKLGSDNRISLLVDMKEDYDLTVLKENAEEILDSFQNALKEAQGVLSHIQKELDIFKSPAMERVTNTSTFDLSSITEGNKRIFLIIPPDRLDSHAKWLRVMIGSTIMAVQRNKNKPVLLLMDEFASLGHMEIIEKNMGLTPEYHLQFWAILQDLSQLQKHYPKAWETFLANSVVTTWLGIRDNKTSEYLSTLLGKSVVKYRSDRSIKEELHGGTSQPPEKFELLKQSPLSIRENEGIIAVYNGQTPIQLPKTPYYLMDRLAQLADENPLREEK